MEKKWKTEKPNKLIVSVKYKWMEAREFQSHGERLFFMQKFLIEFFLNHKVRAIKATITE